MTDVRHESSESVFARVATLERTLDGVRRELEHQQRLALTGTVAAGVAHEVNNVLTPALAHARKLLADAAQTSASDALDLTSLERIARGIESATTLLQTMLDFASNHDDDDVAGIDASLDAAIECLGRDLAHDRIDLTRDIPVSARVSMNSLALQQVFLNMLLNARVAMAGRPGRIEIVASQGAGDVTTITVSDTGPGIPSAIIDRVFEPFVTQPAGVPSGAGGPGNGGSGLGLAVCRRSIEAAGGSISAATADTRGARFVIALPTAA